jgi:hypothetical protein
VVSFDEKVNSMGNIEGVVKAAGQNMKRLLNYNNRWNPKHPAGGVLLYFSLGLVYRYSVALDILRVWQISLIELRLSIIPNPKVPGSHRRSSGKEPLVRCP